MVSQGKCVEGQVTLDMRTIDNESVEDPTVHGVLNQHLKSDDFFDVERYPTADLEIRSAHPLEGATPGTPNFQFQADLKIKDVTHAIEFPAIVACGEDGAFASVAQIEIDRTRWGVIYGSGRFFKMLGMHLVNDAITLFVRLIAR
jgi:polyisoprenoid-binding protein YceI